MSDELPDNEHVESLARAISPHWFIVENGVCGLDNYPGQHLKFQESAREKARAILEPALREAIQAERDRWRVALDTANERANTLERLLSQPITPPKGLNPKERASFVINEFERRSAQARSRK